MTKRFLAAALPALLLSACTGGADQGLETVHQPVVSRADYLLDLRAVPGGLAPGERQRLAGWLTGLRLGYGDRVSVDDPAGADLRARDAIAAVVADFGLLVADTAPVTPAPVEPGSVRVVVSRMAASVPGCPDWSRDPSITFAQRTSASYGCATNTNLAAMIANPSELIRGNAAPRGDAATSFKAIDAYRKAAPTGGGGTSVGAGGGGGGAAAAGGK